MVDIPSYVGIPLLIFFIAMHAFYSATETAFTCLNQYRFKVEAEDGNKTARRVLKLYDHFDTTLISSLVGSNVAAVLLSFISTMLFMKWFGEILDDSVVSLIASISMAVLTFLFGDAIPKMIGKRMSDKVVRFNVYPMMFFIVLFYPLTLIFRGISWVVHKIFKMDQLVEVTEEDFTSAVEEIEEAGMLEENESDLIQATLEFDDTSVKEVLTSKRKMVMLDLATLTTEKLLKFLSQCEYSRIPLYAKNRNNVVGILVVKNFLNAYLSSPKTTNYKDYVQKPYFVTPSVMIDDLLDGLKKHHTHIAIVRKEGELIGMVTMEDVLEELFGGIKETGKNILEEVAK